MCMYVWMSEPTYAYMYMYVRKEDKLYQKDSQIP